MNKQELIKKLDKAIQEVQINTNWLEHIKNYEKGKKTGLRIGLSLAEQLDEPEITKEQLAGKQELIKAIEAHLKETEGENTRDTFDQGYEQGMENAIGFIEQFIKEPEITEEQAWEAIGGYNGMTAKEANQMFADGMVNRKSDKTIRRDDVLDRLQEIGEHNRNEWIEVILRVFGNVYGTAKYREGYQKGWLEGKLEGKQTELPVIPQFVADWYEDHKDNIYYHVSKKIQSAENNNDKSMCLELIEFWLMDFENENIGKTLKLKDGYMIEKKPRYRAKVNNDLYYVRHDELDIVFIRDDAPGFIERAKVFIDKEEAEKVADDVNGYVEELPKDEVMKLNEGWKK